MSNMTLAARLNSHPDRPSSAEAPPAETRTRSPGAAGPSLVRHWPLLFILAGTAAMVGWIGAIAWAAVSLLLWMLG